MIQRPNRATKRNRKRSGTVIMELGMMLLPTFAIIFGFLDVGFAIFTWNTLQNAVREGTRYAITMRTDGQSPSGQINSIKRQTATWSMNFVSATSTSTTGPQVPWVDVRFFDPVSNAAQTGVGSNSPGNVVEVSIRNYPYKWMFPFSGTLFPAPNGSANFYSPLGSTMNLNVYSADVLGGTGLGGLPTP
jgi:Flp pilus assembly protein TadG